MKCKSDDDLARLVPSGIRRISPCDPPTMQQCLLPPPIRPLSRSLPIHCSANRPALRESGGAGQWAVETLRDRPISSIRESSIIPIVIIDLSLFIPTKRLPEYLSTLLALFPAASPPRQQQLSSLLLCIENYTLAYLVHVRRLWNASATPDDVPSSTSNMPGILPMKVIRVGNSAQARIAQACDRCRSKKIR